MQTFTTPLSLFLLLVRCRCFSFDYKTKFVLKSRTRVAPVAPLASAAAMTRFTTWKKKKKRSCCCCPSAECLDGAKGGRAYSSSPARPTGQQTHKPVVFFWPLPLRDDDGGYRPFRLAAAPRAIPKKKKKKKETCVCCFVSPFVLWCHHSFDGFMFSFFLFWFDFFSLQKILLRQMLLVGRPTSLVTHITSITISYRILPRSTPTRWFIFLINGLGV